MDSNTANYTYYYLIIGFFDIIILFFNNQTLFLKNIKIL